MKNWLTQYCLHARSQIVHQTIEQEIIEAGRLTPSYLFFVFTSCSIAILGLLLNSTAVIIGAMLIAPLMNSIVLIGFSIAKTDVDIGWIGTKTLLLGVGFALVTSFGIVKLSPFIPPTPEILARTNPNLFDLLVAFFSGLVAAHAMIRKQGGVIAGVAIATAIMPPLASAGYGLATANYLIFKGAFFLFLTNMVAITLSVSGMAIWYGFGVLHTKRELIGKTAIAGLILVVISIPLVQTLELSVRQTILSKQIEEVIKTKLEPTQGQLDKLSIEVNDNNTVRVETLILTKQYQNQLEHDLKEALKAVNPKIQLVVNQVQTGEIDLQKKINRIVQTVQQDKERSENDQNLWLLTQIKDRLAIQPLAHEIRLDKKQILVFLPVMLAPTLSEIREIEEKLRVELNPWEIILYPPLIAPVPLYFEDKQIELTTQQLLQLETWVWLCQRWGVKQVTLSGYAALNEGGKQTATLVQTRLTAVKDILEKAQIHVAVKAMYPFAQQREFELQNGKKEWRKVQLILDRPLLTN